MSVCIWVQYNPSDALIPGLVRATVTGDSEKPPIIKTSLLQAMSCHGTFSSDTDGNVIFTLDYPYNNLP